MSLVIKLFLSKFLLIQQSEKSVARKFCKKPSSNTTILPGPAVEICYWIILLYDMGYFNMWCCCFAFFATISIRKFKLVQLYAKESDLLSCESVGMRNEALGICPTFSHVCQWPPELHLGHGLWVGFTSCDLPVTFPSLFSSECD